MSPGTKFRQAVARTKPLAIVGTINAYSALQAKQAGFEAIYLSGSGVATASYGLPDLGLTHCQDVLIDAQRITKSCDLPLLVDIDTGWEDEIGIEATITQMESAGVAAVHIEDQVSQKRCGHRPGKQIVPSDDMVLRIKACIHARHHSDFVIMARTDAFANEGLNKTVDRCKAYIDAGVDMLFLEAIPTLADYAALSKTLSVPLLANLTEFGKTPNLSQQALYEAGIAMVLYPLTAFRAMSYAAKQVYQTLYQQQSIASLLNQLQTRDDLYDTLDYWRYEREFDQQLKGKS